MVIAQLISIAAIIGIGFLGYNDLSNVKFVCDTIQLHYETSTVKLGSFKAGDVCNQSKFKYLLLQGSFALAMIVRILGNYLGWKGYLVLLA